MFKKVLQSISKSLHRQQVPAPEPKKGVEPAKKGGPAPAPAPAADSKLKPMTGAAPAVAEAPKTPEEMCGITAKMNKEQIREHLKVLYRRFNRAASSLDAKTRKEADDMLDAIVTVREKHFGSI